MSNNANKSEPAAVVKAYCVLSINQIENMLRIAKAQRRLAGGEEMGGAECLVLEGQGSVQRHYISREDIFHFAPETVRSPYVLDGERF